MHHGGTADLLTQSGLCQYYPHGERVVRGDPLLPGKADRTNCSISSGFVHPWLATDNARV
ncbi:hypothetical protein [Kitasatospora sp. MAP5-34]|uniref:hypothetical protein n=1 Tax=Kitasatospora sp. MAP5-34 TaxID=3035102 RepID=UPI0024738397|nr:hypothetical protein [Kitasatospora sp. MAP5-34]